MSDKLFDRLMYEALLLSGEIAAQTPEEVEIALTDFDESKIEIPQEMLDADAVADGRIKTHLPDKS